MLCDGLFQQVIQLRTGFFQADVLRIELVTPVGAGTNLTRAAFHPRAGASFHNAIDKRVGSGNVVEREVIAERFVRDAARNVGMFEEWS